MRTRRFAAVLSAVPGVLAVGAAPAFASGSGQAGWGLGETLLVTVSAAVGICLVITLAVVLPGLLHRPRYRPGRPWQHEAVWFGGPADAEEQRGRTAPPGSGGAHLGSGGSSAEW